MVTRWTFFDPTTSTTAEFEINPNDGGSPSLVKNITASSTVAPGGATILMEGSSQLQDFTFSGTILTQSQYDQMVTWFTKTNVIQLTDDLGRTYDIYIKEFAPKRVRASSHPWKHTYSVTAIQV